MKIKEGVDLGKAFEALKNDLRHANAVSNTTDTDPLAHSKALGYLSASVQFFLFENTDTATMQEVLEDKDEKLLTQLQD